MTHPGMAHEESSARKAIAPAARGFESGGVGRTYIAIAGNMGAGKTTLVEFLCSTYGVRPFLEPGVDGSAGGDNPYLADFYADMSRWSFPLQIFFLNHRFKAHQKITLETNSAIQDRSIYEDANIFARNLYEQGMMEERDYRTYVQLFRNMSNFMCKPSVIVFLDVSPEASADRIRMRNRGVEANIELGYLRALHDGYEEFVTRISKVIPVIRVDYERFATAEEMAEVIKREYLDASFLRRVTAFDPAR
jgi:deoxyadenosine kinase